MSKRVLGGLDGFGRAETAFRIFMLGSGLLSGALAYAGGQPAWVIFLAVLGALALAFIIARGVAWMWESLFAAEVERSPILLGPYIACERQMLVTPSGTEVPGLEKAGFFLIVGNERSQTLRNVQARMLLPNKAVVLRSRFNQERPDIQHGEYVFFEFGWIATDQLLGTYSHEKFVQPTDTIHALVENHKNGHHSLTIAAASRDDRISIASSKTGARGGFPIVITVSADDVESKTIRYRMDLAKLPNLEEVFAPEEPE